MGKKFGQHFLHDRHVLERIAATVACRPGDHVLEVGPGKGPLTAQLLATGATVTAVEIDPAMLPGLEQRFGDNPRFRLIAKDILKTSLEPADLFAGPQPYLVAANIPYNITSPLLFRFLAHRRHLTRVVLMVQLEVAKRMAAMPSDGKEYGSLSVALAAGWRSRLLFQVPPGAFHPPPKVHSAVVALEAKPAAMPPEDEARYLDHVQKLFSKRRKRMDTTLRGLYGGAKKKDPKSPAGAGKQKPSGNQQNHQEEAWQRVDERIAGRRPEALTPEEHLGVFQMIRDMGV